MKKRISFFFLLVIWPAIVLCRCNSSCATGFVAAGHAQARPLRPHHKAQWRYGRRLTARCLLPLFLVAIVVFLFLLFIIWPAAAADLAPSIKSNLALVYIIIKIGKFLLLLFLLHQMYHVFWPPGGRPNRFLNCASWRSAVVGVRAALSFPPTELDDERTWEGAGCYYVRPPRLCHTWPPPLSLFWFNQPTCIQSIYLRPAAA